MVSPGFGTHLARVLAAAAMFAIAAPASATALTKPERKAVDIKGAEAASISTAAFAEIRFKGNYREEQGTGGLKRARTTIELIPEQGETTVITDRGSSRRPKDARAGTTGFFDLGRDGRTISLLVEDLPAPAARIRVTTSGPGAGSRVTRRRGLGGLIDIFELSTLQFGTPEELEAEITSAEADLEATDKAINDVENDLDELNEEIGRAERAVRTAETKAGKERAQKRLERLKESEDQRLDLRRRLRRSGDRLERWIKDLKEELQARSRQCSDRVDNADEEDTIADHAGGDPGCENPADNDEKDVVIPVTCPSVGNSTSPFAVISTPQSNAFTSLSLRKISDGAQILSTPISGTSGASAPVPGNVCGPGVEVNYQWVIFTDGTPFSLPDPPPGEHGICLFLEVDNPMGSGNPGGQDASLRFAVGTAPV